MHKEEGSGIFMKRGMSPLKIENIGRAFYFCVNLTNLELRAFILINLKGDLV